MKANRLNLCSAVRKTLLAAGYSTVKVVSAVNADLGRLEVKTGEVTTATSKMGKDETFKVSLSQKAAASGKLTLPLRFDVWHGQVSKSQDIAAYDLSIPALFVNWLDSFAKGKPEEIAKEQADDNKVVATA